jgi:hypothetical protein
MTPQKSFFNYLINFVTEFHLTVSRKDYVAVTCAIAKTYVYNSRS